MASIASEFPSQGKNRHLSNEGRTQMAGDLLSTGSRHTGAVWEKAAEGQQKNLEAVAREANKPVGESSLDTANIRMLFGPK